MDGRAEVVAGVKRGAEEIGLALRLWGEELGEQEREDLQTLQGALTICAEDLELEADDHADD